MQFSEPAGRIATDPKVATHPLSGAEAWSFVWRWLESGPVWIPPVTERTAAVLGRLVAQVPVTGNLVPDAQLAALAIEHGLVVMTADTDFERSRVCDGPIRWRNDGSSQGAGSTAPVRLPAQ